MFSNVFRSSTSRALAHTKSGAANAVICRTYHQKGTAQDMMKKSCYHGVNFRIDHDATVYDAIKRMAGINLGCLAVSDGDSIVGIVTERDYLKKVELQGGTASTVKVSEIMTRKARMIVASEDETPEQLMSKMLSSDIRHLPVVNEDGNVVGLLSIKDIVRELNEEHQQDVDTLTSFALGKGGHFVLD